MVRVANSWPAGSSMTSISLLLDRSMQVDTTGIYSAVTAW
jgi:hypothetical protein